MGDIHSHQKLLRARLGLATRSRWPSSAAVALSTIPSREILVGRAVTLSPWPTIKSSKISSQTVSHVTCGSSDGLSRMSSARLTPRAPQCTLHLGNGRVENLRNALAGHA